MHEGMERLIGAGECLDAEGMDAQGERENPPGVIDAVGRNARHPHISETVVGDIHAAQ